MLGAGYLPGTKVDVYEDKSIQRVVLMMGRWVESVEDCVCGNTIAVTGLENFLLKGTLSLSLCLCFTFSLSVCLSLSGLV